MSSFNDAYNNDKKFKESLINEVITSEKQEAYKQAIEYTMDDLFGVMEAYKHGSISGEDEAQEQIKIFLEEYTVKLLNITKGK